MRCMAVVRSPSVYFEDQRSIEVKRSDEAHAE